MTRRSILSVVGFFAAAILVWWILFVAVPRWFREPAQPAPPVAATPAGAPAAERKITATLFFVSEDGLSLVPVQREIPFADPVVEQARHVVEAQIAPAPAPLAS